MELTQLRYFQKVARTKSITKAAQELYISQPTLSQSLSRLESSLGCPLFTHQPGKRMQLNESGELFLKTVDRMFEELEHGIDQVRELNERARSQVSIASSIHDLCEDLVLGFFDCHRDAKISQRLVPINSLTDLLLADEIDFAISPCPIEDPRMDSRPLYMEELLAVVGPKHRLFGKKWIGREDILGEKFICNYSEAGRIYLEDMLFQDAPDGLDIILESNEVSTIRKMVESGLGITFMPARVVYQRVKNQEMAIASALRVSDHQADTPTCITKKKSRILSGSALEFFQFAVSFCQEEDGRIQRFLAEHFGHL